jgi:hypothetical protein
MKPGSGLPSSQPGAFRRPGQLFDPQGNAIAIGSDRTISTIASEHLTILTRQGVPGEAIYHILLCELVGFCKLFGVPKDQLKRKLDSDWKEIGASDGAEAEIG